MKVKLLRPLDGKLIGSVVEYPDDDAKRLEASGVVSFYKEKSAPEPANKKAPEVANKAAPSRDVKKGG